MTEEQFKDILDACKPVPYIIIAGMEPASPQENANDAWRRLGEVLGFKYMSVRPLHLKGPRFFTAEPKDE